MSDKIQGFQPVFDANSELLILGSFPSVKSRAVDFYYGNRQNRFWKMLFGYFGEEVREDVSAKREFVLRRHVALWDVVSECEIVGSSDASITGYAVAEIPAVLKAAPIRLILLNGAVAYKIFCENFAGDRGAVSAHAVHQPRESSLRSGRLVCRSRLGFRRGKIEELRRGK